MQVGVLALQAPLLERLVEHVHQLVELKRLGDEVRGAELDHVDGVFHGAVAGDDDGDDAGVALSAASITCRPSTPGRRRSETMTSKAKPSSALSAASPSAAWVTSKAFVRKSFSHNTSQRFLVVYQEEVGHGLSKY